MAEESKGHGPGGKTKKPWYKSKTFWLISAAIAAAGVAVYYLLLGGSSSSSSQAANTAGGTPTAPSGSEVVPASSSSGSGSGLTTLESTLTQNQDALIQAITQGNTGLQQTLETQIAQLQQQIASQASGGSGGSSGSTPSTVPTTNINGMTRVSPTASPLERLRALAQSTWVSLPGVSAAQVGSEAQYAKNTQAVSGVLSNGVAQLNLKAPWSQQLSLLQSDNPVSIPGVSAAQMGYLKSQAKQGNLAGIGANGKAIYKS